MKTFKMKSIAFFGASLIPLTLFAQFPIGLEVSKIDRWDYFCQTASRGGAYAIDLKGQRIWQTGEDRENGLQLSDVEITMARCPHCLNFTGKLIADDQSIEIEGKLETANPFSKPTSTLKVTFGGQKLPAMKCEINQE